MTMLDKLMETAAWQELARLWDVYVTPLLTYAERVLARLGWTDPALSRAVFAAALLLLLGGVLLLIRAVRARREMRRMRADLARATRSARRLGYASAIILLGTLGGWASIAHLSSATLAPGIVSPDGHRKTIQHLEGGIVRTIHVREGDRVAVGDKLITMSDTMARASHRELRERYSDLLATEARLVTEKDGGEAIAFPAELTGMADVDARRVIDDQTSLFASRRATVKGREQILGQRIRQVEEEIAGLNEMIAAEDRQLELIDQEIVGVKKLYDQGLERLPRLLALYRAKAEIEAERSSNRAKVARSEQEIGETRMQLLTMHEQDREKVNEDLTKVRAALAEVRSQLSARQDVLKRTVITAPIAGRVMNIKVTTETGVVSAGEPLLDIVPDEAKLIVDAQVKPVDIDNVVPGMRARVVLTAYRQRNLPQIHGVLRSVSADSLVEERTGHAYFLAKIEVDPNELARLKNVRLMPGMPAEVMIMTGDQTVLDYIIRPLAESIRRSFRDQ
jgi:HlyD family secretion protein/epimerase transport system membrane fusion protein